MFRNSFSLLMTMWIRFVVFAINRAREQKYHEHIVLCVTEHFVLAARLERGGIFFFANSSHSCRRASFF